MSYASAVDISVINRWIASNADHHTVQQQLSAMGLNQHEVDAYLKQYKKSVYAKRQFKGFMCMGIGAFVGFLSCVLTLTNPVPEIYNIVLYGLTSAAIIIIMIGLYFVFD